MKSPLAVTTSDRGDPPLRARAREAAEALGLPFIERLHKRPLRTLLEEEASALVVFEAEAVSLVDPLGTLRFSPGLAHLRIKQLDADVREDMLLRRAAFVEGDHVLDCTVGLAADAQVAARCVGPGGAVTALEKSPALFLLVRHGLAGLPLHPRACRIDVLHQDAATYLRSLPSRAYDVVLFDPMFERKRRSSIAFETLRRHADYSPLTREMLEDARRVARRCVVVKGSRYSSDFKKLDLRADPARPNATVVWATLPALEP